MKMILKAIEFANQKHEGQFRRVSGDKYITHPLQVSYLVATYKPNSKNFSSLVCAALLHDVVEDCGVTIEEIRELFGDIVADIVSDLTTDSKLSKEIGKNKYLMEKILDTKNYPFKSF